jgi:hypothetical protein
MLGSVTKISRSGMARTNGSFRNQRRHISTLTGHGCRDRLRGVSPALLQQGSVNCVSFATSFVLENRPAPKSRFSSVFRASWLKPFAIKKASQVMPSVGDLVDLQREKGVIMIVARGITLPESRFHECSYHAIAPFDCVIGPDGQPYFLSYDPEGIAKTSRHEMVDSWADMMHKRALSQLTEENFPELNNICPLVRVDSVKELIESANTTSLSLADPSIDMEDNSDYRDEQIQQKIDLMGVFVPR